MSDEYAKAPRDGYMVPLIGIPKSEEPTDELDELHNANEPTTNLQQAIEWAKREVVFTGTGEYCAIPPDDLRELIAAAEQVERAKFGSEELNKAGDKAYESTSSKVFSYFNFTQGFTAGATWVLQRMKGEE